MDSFIEILQYQTVSLSLTRDRNRQTKGCLVHAMNSFPCLTLPLFDLPICWWLRFLPKLTLLSGVSSLHLNIAIHSWRLSNNQQFFVVKNMRTKGDFLIALTFKVEDDCQFWMGKQRSFFISTSSVFSSYILTLSLDCDDAAMAQEKLMWGVFWQGELESGTITEKRETKSLEVAAFTAKNQGTIRSSGWCWKFLFVSYYVSFSLAREERTKKQRFFVPFWALQKKIMLESSLLCSQKLKTYIQRQFNLSTLFFNSILLLQILKHLPNDWTCFLQKLS